MHHYARIAHGDYFRSRDSERELCQDFPGDRMYIEGLHSMQVHLWRNGQNIEIPVVKVMNTAHYLAAYMFHTVCSGDQTEYDTMAYCSVGHDKRLMILAIIVLAAMLQRTEGFRTTQCRDVLLEDRSADFEEGVSLYERFITSAEEHFAEEDFLIDHPAVMELMKEKDILITRQAQHIQQLQYTITTMEKQQNNQYNNCVIYQAPVYNTSTTNNYYAPAAHPDQSQEPSSACSEKEQAQHRFALLTAQCVQEGKAEAVEAELRSAANGSAAKLVAAIRTNEALGYLDTKNMSSQALYDALNDYFGLRYSVRNFTKYRH